MSLTSALGSALSGLTVTSRATSVVSSNIANAQTEGYGVRRLDSSAQVTGGYGAGVRVNGVVRHSDPVLISERRNAGSELGFNTTRAGYLARLESLIGTPDDQGSLSAHFDEFETRLISASNSPGNPSNLEAVLQSASRLAGRINHVSDSIQALRLEADNEIGSSVDTINRSLQQLEELNGQIRVARARGNDANAMIDQQQQIIDRISDFIPLREARNQHGQVVLYSADGVALLDGQAAELEFTTAKVMAPHFNLAGGDLSGLSVNGRAITLSGDGAQMQGGKLAALFEMRDETGVKAQQQIDGVALDLTARLDDPAIDATRTLGDPGLFTDAGALASSTNELGLSSRLRINVLVDPDQGGELWRLRDGLGATTEGSPGNPGLLATTLDALQTSQAPASSVFSANNRTMSGLGADFLSLIAIDRQFAEADQSYAASRHSALREAELSKGVDTDQEMQNLLVLEQAYAANARVVTVVEEMLDQIMRI